MTFLLLLLLSMATQTPTPQIEKPSISQIEINSRIDDEAVVYCMAVLDLGLLTDFRDDFGAPFEKCTTIAKVSLQEGVDPSMALAFAWHENRFREVSRVGSRGELGALQILPKHHCPGRTVKGCCPFGMEDGICEDDLVYFGVLAMQRVYTLYGRRIDRETGLPVGHRDWSNAACHYRGGSVCTNFDYSNAGTRLGKARDIKRRALELLSTES